jgi:hypothetical protein
MFDVSKRVHFANEECEEKQIGTAVLFTTLYRFVSFFTGRHASSQSPPLRRGKGENQNKEGIANELRKRNKKSHAGLEQGLES